MVSGGRREPLPTEEGESRCRGPPAHHHTPHPQPRAVWCAARGLCLECARGGGGRGGARPRASGGGGGLGGAAGRMTFCRGRGKRAEGGAPPLPIALNPLDWHVGVHPLGRYLR